MDFYRNLIGQAYAQYQNAVAAAVPRYMQYPAQQQLAAAATQAAMQLHNTASAAQLPAPNSAVPLDPRQPQPYPPYYPPQGGCGGPCGGVQPRSPMAHLANLVVSPHLDMGMNGGGNCQPRQPMQPDCGEVVDCNISLPVFEAGIPQGGTALVEVRPYRRFQPQVFIYSGAAQQFRITAIDIAGRNQLAAGTRFNPDNYAPNATHARINWDIVESSVPITLTVENIGAAAADFECELKGANLSTS